MADHGAAVGASIGPIVAGEILLAPSCRYPWGESRGHGGRKISPATIGPVGASASRMASSSAICAGNVPASELRERKTIQRFDEFGDLIG